MILAYHAVSSSWRSPLAVSTDVLRQHIRLLERRGYVGLRFSESEDLRRVGNLPERWVAITFDDGFANTALAEPILSAAGFRGTVFVVTDFVESGRPLAWPGLRSRLRVAETEFSPLSWADLERLHEAGWEIGSHTQSHPLLTRLPQEVAMEELQGSRELIEQHLGSCQTVAYPYGVADARVSSLAERAGYTAGCELTRVQVADEPFRRPRIGLSCADRSVRLRIQLSPTMGRLRRSSLARRARRLRGCRSWMPADA